MKRNVYLEIIEYMQSLGPRCNLHKVAKLFSQYSMKTLGSIYSQDYQRKMKRTHHIHYHPHRIDEYYTRFYTQTRNGHKDVLLQMADEVDLSPALLARLILEHHLILADPHGEPPARNVLTQQLKDTTLIDDPLLANEVHMCVVTDDIYGPLVDTIKQYPFISKHILHFAMQHKRKLKEKDMVYLDEDQLRAKGYDKTPDFKLEIPVAVDGHVVNWVESKASFGDEDSHQTYLKEQFWSYWNRYSTSELDFKTPEWVQAIHNMKTAEAHD
ncbi:CDAN1-interacting nuclease 1 [Lamellibrachia satsuma]|nr:CDAN1-interacting nuclease 1 [Lamellibrachia satsuma]KAI0238349.1 CDAN1-interacting nuclease 1 [Lamellibrachia satsuma]